MPSSRKDLNSFSLTHSRIDFDGADFCMFLLFMILIPGFLAVVVESPDFAVVLAFGCIVCAIFIIIDSAGKDLLASVFGRLSIYFGHSFAVGDWIRSPDKKIEGTVDGIGWRLTRIRTFDQRTLYVPNAVFTTITVENPSRMSPRRINETLGVRCDDVGEVAGIVKDIHAMLLAHPEIDPDETSIVNFVRFGEPSLNIMITAFMCATTAVDFHKARQDVLLKIAGIIAAHGTELAYPSRVSYVARLSPDPFGDAPALRDYPLSSDLHSLSRAA
jgi:MscS family membrane protein